VISATTEARPIPSPSLSPTCIQTSPSPGGAEIDFADQDDSTVFVQFNDFPLQADQVTPMDQCAYKINLAGSSGGFQVFTA
jgi:hypothetical protein